MRARRLQTLLASAVWLASGPGASAEETMAFTLRSPEFSSRAEIPAKYTCEGADLSPPLAWSDPPSGTKSFALIVDDPDAPDPDAPKVVWVHWVLYDLPADARALAEGASSSSLPPGTRAGANDWKHASWGGPCPPIGRHRYFFKLYAVDTTLGPRGALSKAELLEALEGHVLAQVELIGTYQKRAAPHAQRRR